MSEHSIHELVSYLHQARSLEQLSLRLLQQGVRGARDAKVAGIYREHVLETEEHLRLIKSRLGSQESREGVASHSALVGALQITLAADTAQTPTELGIAVYALENVEIAVYHLLVGIAERCGDGHTATVLHGILEQEEETAELLASTLDRALFAALDQAAPEQH